MSKRILVVDDTPDLLEGIREFLVMEKYDVMTAQNGLDAFAQMSYFKPDLIVTDLLMPVMDGFTFIEQIKRMDKFKDVPILIFSAKSQKEYEQRALELGVDYFIVKPYPLEKLILSIKELLSHE